MKSFKGFLALAGITVLVVSASAQNPAYSSKAGLFRPAMPVVVPAPVTEVAQSSSKPWVSPSPVTPKVFTAAANVEQKNLTLVDYNSKNAVRGGQSPVEYELAPLK
jgi:hypothetical protein